MWTMFNLPQHISIPVFLLGVLGGFWFSRNQQAIKTFLVNNFVLILIIVVALYSIDFNPKIKASGSLVTGISVGYNII